MFGKRIPNSSAIVVSVKIAIGKGRPIIAWSGSPSAKDADVIVDISTSPSVRRYLDKQVKAGRLKPDESGTLTVPAYLVVDDEENNTADEHKIELTLFNAEISEEISKDNALHIMFDAYSNGIERMSASCVRGLTAVNAGATEALKITATTVPQIIEKSTSIQDKQLGIIDKSLDAERLRANESTDAVVRILDNETRGNKSNGLEDILKALIAAPAALEALKKLFELLSNATPKGG